MGDSKRMGQRGIIAGIIGIMILFIMLFSAFYIAAEADHDCCGEDCPVCGFIEQCEGNLNRLCTGRSAMALILIPVVFMFLQVVLFSCDYMQETPVSMKIRLNN